MTLETYMIKPTSKHNRPLPPTQIMLHGLDNLSAPIQIRINMFLPASTTTPFSEVIDNLKSSLAAALEYYLPITGTVKTNEKGENYIATDPESRLDTPFIVEFKDVPYNGGDSEDISPRGFDVLPPSSSIFAVKVTQFSCGTVAIGTSINHQVADLNGFLDFLELWAQLSRGESIEHAAPPPSDWTRIPSRFFAGLLTQEEVNSPPSPPPFERLSQPAGPPPFLLVESHATRWKFTKDRMEKLKRDFSPTSSSSGQQWISSGDALAALLCGVITRARKHADIPRLEKRSSLESNVERVAMAANGRERAPSNKDMTHRQYFGNFNCLWSLDVSRTDLLNNNSGADVALAIRQHLQVNLSPKSIAQKIAFFEKAQREGDLNKLFWAADIILTNWCLFDLQGPKLDFGWGKPFYSTQGAGGAFPPGYCLMTKTKDTDDVTVLLTIEKDAADVLKQDPVLNTYAELISG